MVGKQKYLALEVRNFAFWCSLNLWIWINIKRKTLYSDKSDNIIHAVSRIIAYYLQSSPQAIHQEEANDKTLLERF